MPSKTFQPLLFDTFQYAYPKSTYQEHFSKRSRNKHKQQFAALNEKYRTLTQSEKSELLTKRARPFTAECNITQQLQQQQQQHQQRKNQSAKATKATHATFDTLEILDNYDANKPRAYIKLDPSASTASASAAEAENNVLKIGDLIQDILVLDEDSKPQQQQHTDTQNNNNNNNNSAKPAGMSSGNSNTGNKGYHWSVYVQEETPPHIIEAKKRLQRLKSAQVNQFASHHVQVRREKTDVASTMQPPMPKRGEELKRDDKLWMYWDKPSTPDFIKDIRQRLGDTRYTKRSRQHHHHHHHHHHHQQQQQPPITATSKGSSDGDDEQQLEPTSDQSAQFVAEQPTKPAESVTPTASVTPHSNASSSRNDDHYNACVSPVNDADKEVGYYYENVTPVSNIQSNASTRGSKNSNGKPTPVSHTPAPRNESTVSNYLREQYANIGGDQPVLLENWMQMANEKEKKAVLMALHSVDETRPIRFNESRVSMRSNKSRQQQHQPTQPQPQPQPNPSQPQQQQLLQMRAASASKGARSCSVQVRKLGTLRNDAFLAPEEQSPASVYFGYNF